MAYDSLVLSAVISELTPILVGARIEKIYQPGKTELIINLHSPSGKQKLRLSADARAAGIHLTSIHRENPMSPPLFCMVLRKHLEGGRIKDIIQPRFERIAHFIIESVDELGRPTEKVLVCEIMGKHSNIILVEKESNNILDAISRFSHSVNRHREVLPGRRYIEPPDQGKLNPLKVSQDDFKNLLWQHVLGNEEAGHITNSKSNLLRLDKWLLHSFKGLSPMTCREIVYRSGLKENSALENFGEFELNKLWASFREITDRVRSKDFSPVVLYDETGVLKDFSAIELLQYDLTTKKYSSTNELLDNFYGIRLEQQKMLQLRDHLLKVTTDEINRSQKRLQFQEEAIQQAEDAAEFRIKGEILTAHIHALKPRQESVTLTDFYDPEQGDIIIELNPALTPAENAQAYFKKYNKAKAGKKAALELKKEIQHDLNYTESLLANIEQAETLKDLTEIKGELIEQGYIKEKILDKRKTRATTAVSNEPLRFETAEGWPIWVGKNNKQNDLITKKAKAEDLWLHVKDIPGSHVIIGCGPSEPSEETLLQAAVLAAYFSKARGSSNVPIDYTRRKYVHKPNGAKPGMVIYENQRTLFVTPPANLGDVLTSDSHCKPTLPG